MEICKKENCCGCYGCVSVCAHNAIDMVEDSHGFVHPTIDEMKCIKCNLCVVRCPVNQRDTNGNAENISVKASYAAFAKSNKLRFDSSSGGIFSLLANMIIEQGGVVFGVKWDDELRPVHRFCETVEDLDCFRKSKYVQSVVGNSYKKAKEFLKQGRSVLFSGVPCQIEALNLFLGKPYPNLYTVDIVCHGVPSNSVWQSYLRYSEEQYADRVVGFVFRHKKPSWISSGVLFGLGNGNKVYQSAGDNLFFNGFVSNLFLRESCYRCRFSNCDRPADITLMDYWGYTPTKLSFCDYYKRGISAILVNSDKGTNLVDEAKSDMLWEELTLRNIRQCNRNLNIPQQPNEKIEQFWNDFLHDRREVWRTFSDKYATKGTGVTLRQRISQTISNRVKLLMHSMKAINFTKYK